MVLQASSKKTTNITVATDFKDLDLVKRAEENSIRNIENAKKKADRIIAFTNQNLIDQKEKYISDLTKKLNLLYKSEENKAKSEAEKIKAEGKVEEEQLKQKVRDRMPKAVDYIVNKIVGN